MLRSAILAVAVIASASAAFAIEPTPIPHVRVIALNAHSRSVNNLRESDFVLYVDQVVTQLTGWMKVQSFFGRSVYTLDFAGRRSQPQQMHTIRVEVKRAGVSLKYPRMLEY